MSMQQMCKHALTNTRSHDESSLQLWIYEKLYPVELPWRSNHMRDEVVRQRIEEHDADSGVADMLDDFHEAHFDEGHGEEEEPEATAKAYYDMLAAAQQSLHGHTKVSQLDAIGHLMAVKSQFTLSRDAFDVMLQVIGSMLPERAHSSKEHV